MDIKKRLPTGSRSAFYQGPKRMFTIAVLGCMLGWLAQWRQSLRPGMISHFLQDVLGVVTQGGH